VIATPPETVPSLIGALGDRGTRAAVVVTAGFGELGENGRRLQQAMLDAARPCLLRIIGPNCVGIMVPALGLDASFSHLAPRPGDLALLTGAIDDGRCSQTRGAFVVAVARRVGRGQRGGAGGAGSL
jgi:acyl-CoA synthetase (NDP forming)